MNSVGHGRSAAIPALAIFFGVGSLIAFTSCLALLDPGGSLEPMWRINPRAREGFARVGSWAPMLLGTVSTTCAFTAVGLWRQRLWGYRLAVGMLIINLLGDVLNVLLGTEPRAIVGVPVVLALLIFLGQSRIRSHFRIVHDA